MRNRLRARLCSECVDRLLLSATGLTAIGSAVFLLPPLLCWSSNVTEVALLPSTSSSTPSLCPSSELALDRDSPNVNPFDEAVTAFGAFSRGARDGLGVDLPV